MTNERVFVLNIAVAAGDEKGDEKGGETYELKLKIYFNLKNCESSVTIPYNSENKTIDAMIEACKNEEDVIFRVIENSKYLQIKLKHSIKGFFESFYFDATSGNYEVAFKGELLSTEIEQIEKEQPNDGLSNR